MKERYAGTKVKQVDFNYQENKMPIKQELSFFVYGGEITQPDDSLKEKLNAEIHETFRFDRRAGLGSTIFMSILVAVLLYISILSLIQIPELQKKLITFLMWGTGTFFAGCKLYESIRLLKNSSPLFQAQMKAFEAGDYAFRTYDVNEHIFYVDSNGDGPTLYEFYLKLGGFFLQVPEHWYVTYFTNQKATAAILTTEEHHFFILLSLS